MTARKIAVDAAPQDDTRIVFERLPRPDGAPSITLGLSAVPGAIDAPDRDAEIDAHVAEILAWKPDMVVAIETPEHAEILDELADALGEVILETVDSDGGAVPDDPDIQAERREILCHVLGTAARSGGGRVLLVAGQGGPDLATLAAELLAIAGQPIARAAELANGLRPANCHDGADESYLGAMPEAEVGEALGLPFLGGFVVTAPQKGAQAETLFGILRADGFYPLQANTPVTLEALTGSTEIDPDPWKAPEIGRDALARAGDVRILSEGDTPAARLAHYAEGFRQSFETPEAGQRPWMHVGMDVVLYISARIDEEEFRSLPQA